jgi:hypothetical protein
MKLYLPSLEAYKSTIDDGWQIGGAILGCVSKNSSSDSIFLKDNDFIIIEQLPNDPWRAIISSKDYKDSNEIEHFRILHKYDPDNKNTPYYFIIRNKSNTQYVIYTDDKKWYPINNKREQQLAIEVGLRKGLVKEQLDFSSSSSNVFYTTSFDFYHIMDKYIKLDNDGILSLQAMYDKKLYDIFDMSANKYRDRIVNTWKIYPNKDPDKLTREEILKALVAYRGKYGTKYIYLFKYPPYKQLGKNMSRILSNKVIYKVNIDDPNFKKLIVDIDWGYDFIRSSNPTSLTEEYYRKVTKDIYFKNYDDNTYPLFSSLHHISLVTTVGTIPSMYIERL